MKEKRKMQGDRVRGDELTDEQVLQCHDMAEQVGAAVAAVVINAPPLVGGVAVGLLSIGTLLGTAEELGVPPERFVNFLQGLVDLHNRRCRLVVARAKTQTPITQAKADA